MRSIIFLIFSMYFISSCSNTTEQEQYTPRKTPDFVDFKNRTFVYQLYANGQLAWEIKPEDIAHYDTSHMRRGISLHRITVKNHSIPKDSIVLPFPLDFYCVIDGERFFWGDYFHKNQLENDPWVTYHFSSSCNPQAWTFPEPPNYKKRLKKGDTLVLHTSHECNVIELMHSKHRRRKTYYILPTIESERFADEYLLDTFYLNAIKKAGIEIR